MQKFFPPPKSCSSPPPPTGRSCLDGISLKISEAAVKSQVGGIIRHRVIPDGRFCDIMATSTTLCRSLLPPTSPILMRFLSLAPTVYGRDQASSARRLAGSMAWAVVDLPKAGMRSLREKSSQPDRKLVKISRILMTLDLILSNFPPSKSNVLRHCP